MKRRTLVSPLLQVLGSPIIHHVGELNTTRILSQKAEVAGFANLIDCIARMEGGVETPKSQPMYLSEQRGLEEGETMYVPCEISRSDGQNSGLDAMDIKVLSAISREVSSAVSREVSRRDELNRVTALNQERQRAQRDLSRLPGRLARTHDAINDYVTKLADVKNYGGYPSRERLYGYPTQPPYNPAYPPPSSAYPPQPPYNPAYSYAPPYPSQPYYPQSYGYGSVPCNTMVR